MNRERNLAFAFGLILVFSFGAGMAQAQAAPQSSDWEKAAGGKQAFEVASVRKNTAGGGSYSNFTLDSGNAYRVMSKGDALAPTGSLFSARDLPLLRYIVFAYKLSGTQELALRFDFYAGLGMHVPEWMRIDHYDIEARAEEPATKDQMRLMMQSLLAERFNLAVHWETREAPVFGLALETLGKLGTHLRLHPASDDCAATAFPEDTDKGATPKLRTEPSLSSLPIPCGTIAHLPASTPGSYRIGGRDVPMALLADSLPTQTGMATLRRPVVDETGLAGRYDFWLEWTPQDTSDVESGGPFREALKNQLGLKLQPQKGAVEVLAIDHVEQPSAN